MRGPKPTPIELSDRQRKVLEKIVRRQKSQQQLVRRAKLILSIGEGNNNQQSARKVGVHRETVKQWRSRWLSCVPQLTAAELSGVNDVELVAMVEQVLMDEPREGAPVKYNAMQVTQIIAIACSDPEDKKRPISHWSGKAIREVAIASGIVEEISERSIQRFLKRNRLKASSQSLLAKR